ncbi:McrC family protein [Poseidonibacter ostreae]|uniref:Restriction endonuclease n=1 Tax=Poseidonibacter ostreae TaxID=2654171 RepID=A0A6L4WUA5_9BACT|nr:restriction endonuclease [Poseidonibacter ostreae]KAB7889977.1 restriction endonuclease [Poseidonibacter ostreae]KAB7891491.1 restriction endonuclease [Poseidonibacter ostreae]
MNYLYENQNIPENLEIHIKDNKSLYPYFEMNFDGIKPKNRCGFLSIENKNYFIIPKISNENEDNLNIFIYMILKAYDIKISNKDLANFDQTKFKYMEFFIRYFSDILFNELKRGIHKTYITKQENLKVLKGKYLLEKNFQNFYHMNIYCEFDEFSIDNELNRFFLYAIKIFKRYSTYSNLHKCEAVFDEVEYSHIDINRLRIKFDRLNHRFEKPFEIALKILKKLSPLVNNSDTKSFAFLFDMSEVFEKFIGNIYKEIDSNTSLQCEKNYGNLKLKPDIKTSNQIIDTKYKLVKNKKDLKTHDKYQMFTYGINFGIRNTMLLYPKHLLYVNEDLKLGIDENLVRLKMKSIDLKCDDIGYENYIKEVNTRIREIK